MNPKYIRNFSIIAHIDHGKSTLSDRILEIAEVVKMRDMSNQVLDSLEIEREKGITVKSAVVSFFYQSGGQKYLFNLIDTPGHVDFSYEVSRSLAACEGAILVVDAAQGVEAQTISNYFLAIDAELTVLPVINKIDLPAADPEGTLKEVCEEFALGEETAVLVSAKNGINIDKLLEKIIEVIPPPTSNGLSKFIAPVPLPILTGRKCILAGRECMLVGRKSILVGKGMQQGPADLDDSMSKKFLKAMIFDSFFDKFRGVILCIRVFTGRIDKTSRVKLHFSGKVHDVDEVGWLGITRQPTEGLSAGEVGYAILGIKSVREVKSGDTIFDVSGEEQAPVKGYKESKSVVFAGVFPVNSDEYEDLGSSMERLGTQRRSTRV